MARVIALILLTIVAANARSVIRESSHRQNNYIIPADLRYLFGLEEEPQKREVCETEDCKLISKIMKASMDKSVNPCDDFYAYACGMWPENNMVPNASFPYSLWAFVSGDVENRTEDLLGRDLRPDDPLPIKLAKKFYDTCMNVSEIEKAGLEPFVTTLSRIGGWPLIMETEEWSEEDFPWQKVDDYYARLTGQNMFYSVQSIPADDTMTEFIPLLLQPILALDTNDLIATDDDQTECDDSPEIEPGDSPIPDNDEGEGEGKTEGEDENKDEDEDENEDEREGSGNGDEDEDEDDNQVDTSNSEDNDESKDTDESDEDEKRLKKHVVKRETRHRKRRVHKQKKFTVKHPMKKSKNHKIKKQAKATADSDESKDEKEQSLRQEVRQRYANLIAEVALAIAEAQGDKISRKTIEKDIEDLVDFTVKLKVLVKATDGWNNINTTINELQVWYDEQNPETPTGQIQWLDKMSNLFNEANAELTGNTRVKVNIQNYLKGLVPLLNKTPMRTIVNYIHWSFVSNMLSTSTQKMQQLYYNWNSDEEDQSAETPERENGCKKIIDTETLLAYDYVKRYTSQEVRKSASDMVEHIQKAVKMEVTNSKWMNDWAKSFVLDKLENMKKIVGYPEWYNNETAVNKYYNGLVIGPSFFENLLSYKRYKAWGDLKYVSKPEIDIEDMVEPLVLNAFYVPSFNALAVTAADLQSPLFAASRPATINYGIIGVVLGHEVNHGFDDDGIKFDKQGKVTEWLSTMAEEYSKRAECFVEQYENYANQMEPNGTFKGYGNNTRNENIADTMGLEACYNALKMTENEKGRPEATIPEFEDFTTDQLFFLSYANLWCGSKKENGLPADAMKDPHSTGPLRVRGAVSNMKAFAEAFSCPVGSPMNPQKKCNIWN